MIWSYFQSAKRFLSKKSVLSKTRNGSENHMKILKWGILYNRQYIVILRVSVAISQVTFFYFLVTIISVISFLSNFLVTPLFGSFVCLSVAKSGEIETLQVYLCSSVIMGY